MREILNGMIDMHVHNGPSNAKRLFDTGEFCMEADKAGYKAFITKDHYFPSMMTAMQTNSLLEGKVKTKAYGSLILNNSVGGLSLKAVDAACALDAKYLSLPTISAANHIEYYKGKAFAGEAGMVLAETPIPFLDEKGELVQGIEDILQFLSRMENAPVLATGHGSREELDVVIHRASELDVAILLNHPYYGFDARLEDIEKWAALGAYVELTAVVFLPSTLPPIEDFVAGQAFMEKLLERVPMDRFVLDSDMGQKIFESPVEGIYKFIQIFMKDYKVTEDEINLMGKITPAKLMHL